MIDLRWQSLAVAGPGPTLEQVVARLPAAAGAVLLESLHDVQAGGRWCLVAFDPVETLAAQSSDPLVALSERLRGLRIREPPPPFTAGWIGFLGYEAGRFLERLPGRAAEDLGLPRAWFGLYDTAALFDRRQGHWRIAGVEWPAGFFPKRPGLSERLADMAAFLAAAAAASPPAPRPSAQQDHFSDAAVWGRGLLERSGYEANVRRIKAHIRAGDIYQANLTQRLALSSAAGGREIYQRLRRRNPANYAAWLQCGDFEVLSSSPELFLEVSGEDVLTRPIKGTRPRAAGAGADAALRAELAASEKDLAELAMIVDVERNDLGRVCTDIRAGWPPKVETHPTVHHLVAEVRGRLRPGRDVIDLLRAAFPGGSITGAPKIRAMEIIDSLEPWARGPYCGCLGFLGLDRCAVLSIAIRTLVARKNNVYVHVGSGIVADSDPAEEYAELEAKACGMLAALAEVEAKADP